MADIVITYGVPAEGFAALSGHSVHIPPACQAFSRSELMALLPQADAVLACTAFDRELIKASQRLKLIVCYGAGYDAIDVAAATAHGILVANTPDSVTAPTAELAIAHLTALARGLPTLDRRMHAEEPRTLFGMGKHMGTSLEGATLGIVGLGRIGQKVADFGRLMGRRVLYTAHAPKPEREALGDRFVTLETLLAQSDFVSLHCPCTEETRGMISRERIALMKPGAYLINTARGTVIDEKALIEALKAGRNAGAGLDGYVDEPNGDPALCKLDIVLLTPHAGSNTLHARNQMAQAASERILDVLAGRAPQNLLNPELLSKQSKP